MFSYRNKLNIEFKKEFCIDLVWFAARGYTCKSHLQQNVLLYLFNIGLQSLQADQAVNFVAHL